MKLIAIETSTECCSVAVTDGSNIHHWAEVIPRGHGEFLLKKIDELLALAGWHKSELDGIVCGMGPGAFTGVRLGVAVAQAMALAVDQCVYPVSSLQALAMAGFEHYKQEVSAIRVTLDARMGEVYWQAFSQKTQTPLMAPQISKPDEVQWPSSDTWVGLGHGWRTYPVIGGCHTTIPLEHVFLYPLAHYALKWMMTHHPEGVAPEALTPMYLRNKVALTEAERKAASTGQR
ncbi:MAG: tRNA (adenosine(37)-N6)-threonylcarbamoyltransferase complex dimerization subunit type 1 TsaB [Gammaproteobacteria bacterium]|nr:MAG: tRNA (adenosine(37)-N6)-threonylcarbamoyltransferase complex dimerization subunit type 1 TsaB [Gammaproteobacteria bacterium]